MILPNHQTKLYGILGNPLPHTLSPLLHNFLFQKNNINSLYWVFDRDKESVPSPSEWKKWRVQGLSVTIPYKEWAFSIADDRDKASRFLGASNTLLFQEDRISAWNTDGMGAWTSIQNYATANWKSQDILLIGNGGSAKGILYVLLENLRPNQKIYLAARNESKSNEILARLGELAKDKIESIPLTSASEIRNQVNLVIQTTPLGMKGKEQVSPLPSEFWREGMNAFDIVYNPWETVFVKEAKAKGANLIPGLSMLLYQGIVQFELFSGITVPQEQIEEVYDQMVKTLLSKQI